MASWALTAINNDGTLDATFGGTSATIDGVVSAGTLAALAIDANGNILAAGSSPDTVNPAANDAVLARFTSGTEGVNVAYVAPSDPSVGLFAADGVTPITAYSEGDGSMLLGSFTAAGSEDAMTVSINWGDGSPVQTQTLDPGQTDFSVPAHEYAASGTYTVGVTVADPSGGSCSTTTSVGYTLIGPSAASITPSASTIYEDNQVTLSGTFSDPATQNGCTVSINWGDGSAPMTMTLDPGATSFTSDPYTYTTPSPAGGFTVTVTIIDGAASTSAATTITVNPLLPLSMDNVTVDNATVGASINKGGVATLSADVADLGGLGFSVTVNWGANQGDADTIAYPAGTTSFTITHQYVDAGSLPFAVPYNIVITVTSSDGRTLAANTSVAGTDVAPTVNITGEPSNIEQGTRVSVSAVVADPGEYGTFTYSWTATGGGDSFSGTSATFSFTPTNDDDHEVTLAVTDADGETVSEDITIPGAGWSGGTNIPFQPDDPTVTIQDCDADENSRLQPGAGREPGVLLVSVAGNMPNDGTVDVYYTTEDGTDHAGIDYTPTYGDKELTFSYNSSTGGYASQIVQVDTDATAEDGTFSLVIPCFYDSNASIPGEADPSATATIAASFR